MSPGGIIMNFFAHYGEERELNATRDQLTIAEHIQSLCPTSRLVRVSDDYLTIKCVETDICRFKYTDRAKWMMFPYLKDKTKRRFSTLDELTSFDEAIRESYAFAVKSDEVN